MKTLSTDGPEPDRQRADSGAANPAPRVARLRRAPLLWLLGLALALLLGILLTMGFVAEARQAGTPLRQGAALAGTCLLFVPLLFSVFKRGGLSQRPPAWFVAHVLASCAGLVLVSVHASGGRLLSPPGLVLALLFFLVLQGIVARVFLSERLSRQFASRTTSFHQVGPAGRAALAAIIERKRALLLRLDAQASEALFSPNLRHALRHPWLTLRYARLAAAEARLVGARRKAGLVLSLWRRVHIAAAAIFLAAVVVHVLIVSFFAGYAAGGRPIYWWHLAAWGA